MLPQVHWQSALPTRRRLSSAKLVCQLKRLPNTSHASPVRSRSTDLLRIHIIGLHSPSAGRSARQKLGSRIHVLHWRTTIMLKAFLFLRALRAHVDRLQALLGEQWPELQARLGQRLNELIAEQNERALSARVNRIFRLF